MDFHYSVCFDVCGGSSFVVGINHCVCSLSVTSPLMELKPFQSAALQQCTKVCKQKDITAGHTLSRVYYSCQYKSCDRTSQMLKVKVNKLMNKVAFVIQ